MAKPFLFFLERHPRTLGLLLLVLTVIAGFGSRLLLFNDVPKQLFETDTPDFEILSRVEREFSTDENDCLIVLDAPQQLFRPDALRGFRQLTADAAEIDGIERVFSMESIPVFAGAPLPRPLLPGPDASEAEFARARSLALAHPIVGGVLLSRDARTALVVVRLAGRDLAVEGMRVTLEAVREVCDRAEETGGFRCYLTGAPAVRVAILATMKRDQKTFTIAGALVSTLVSLVLFRRLTATIVMSAGPLIGLVWTFGVLGFFGLEINSISTVLPTLVLVIGYTDAVHLGLDIRRQRAAGVLRREAAINTVRRLALPCGLTSLSTAIGFGSLCVAGIPSIQNLGLVTSIGAVVTFLAVLTVVPFLATTRLGESIVHEGVSADVVGDPRWERLARPVLARPALVATLGVLATCGLGYVSTGLRPDTKMAESVPTAFEAYDGIVICDRAFGGVLEAQVLVEWDMTAGVTSDRSAILTAIDAAARRVEASDVVGSPLSILDVLASLPGTAKPIDRGASLVLVPAEAKARFLREDLGRALIRFRVPDRYASEMRPIFEKLAGELGELESKHAGFRYELTGPVVVVGKKVQEMIRELLRSLGVAVVLIFVLLTLSFRSVALGLISLVPNIFPMVVTATVIVLLGWPLVLANVIVFSVCLGIAVDDTIHFIAAYRRSLDSGRSPGEAVMRSFVKIGTALVITTIVFVTGFACTVLSELNVIRMFGMLSCVAISSALIGDLFILPALLLWMHRVRYNSGEIEDTTIGPGGGTAK